MVQKITKKRHPYHYIFQYERSLFVQLFFEHDLVRNSKGENIFHIFVRVGSVENFKRAIRDIPNSKELLNERNLEGKTVLELAVQHRRKPFFEILFEAGVDPNTKTSDGKYLFHQVAKEKESGVLEAFLEAGVKVDEKDLEGRSLFHIIAERTSTKSGFKFINTSIQKKFIKLLIKYGLDSDVRNLEGENVLHSLAKIKKSHSIRSTFT